MSDKLEKFEMGDRVILVGEELIPWKTWPVWGSKYSCVGTIDGIGSAYSNVQWDNGSNRMIDSHYLRHFAGVEEISPNRAFIMYKRSINAKR